MSSYLANETEVFHLTLHQSYEVGIIISRSSYDKGGNQVLEDRVGKIQPDLSHIKALAINSCVRTIKDMDMVCFP